MQIAVAAALAEAAPDLRYALLLHNAPGLAAGVRWRWKAFVEGRIHTYVAQEQALETYAVTMVQAFSDTITATVKTLSDAMLAAVVAVLGSFVGAVLQSTFNPTVFALGMGVYAGYVLLFPGLLGSLHQWQSYCALVEATRGRRKRFDEQLYPKRVDEIMGTQLDDARTRFRSWLAASIVAYLVVAALALVAARTVPGLVAPRTLIPTSKHATAAAHGLSGKHRPVADEYIPVVAVPATAATRPGLPPLLRLILHGGRFPQGALGHGYGTKGSSRDYAGSG